MKMRKERNINISALEEKISRVIKKNFGSKVDVKKHQYAGSNKFLEGKAFTTKKKILG